MRAYVLLLCFSLFLPSAHSASATATTEDARAVARLYSAAFDREPESEGLNFWVDSLEKGVPLTQIAQKFNESEEFISKYGALQDDGFVRQLYRNVLRREGEQSGVAFWIGSLADAATRASVLQAFSDSAENRRKTDDLFADMHLDGEGVWTYAPISGVVHSRGTIDGFGSIFVNGVEFETDAADITVDGVSSRDDSLRLGMVVTVDGVVNDDGVTGDASRVVFDNELQGPISAIVPGPDGDTLELTILGVTVIVERAGTVFDDVSFNALAVNDLVEVSGFVDDGQRLRATRLEKISRFVAGTSEVELKGVVSNLAGTEFKLGNFIVEISGADLSELPGGVLADGMSVEVKGTLRGERITATRIHPEDDVASGFDDDDEVSIHGAVTGFVDQSQFQVNGISVDASSSVFKPFGLVLADGLVVEVEGNWDGSVLVARKVESRRGRIEIEASVDSVDTGGSTVTLQLADIYDGLAMVTVKVGASTLMDDNTQQSESLTLEDISGGDFLEVEAVKEGASLVATRINRDDEDDDIVQAPVESFVAGSSITLLGVTYSTTGTQFRSRDNEAISSTTFYSQLTVGDLVKVKDRETADGIADEVEFEHHSALDGDDDDECQSGDGSPDDDCNSDDDSDDDSTMTLTMTLTTIARRVTMMARMTRRIRSMRGNARQLGPTGCLSF